MLSFKSKKTHAEVAEESRHPFGVLSDLDLLGKWLLRVWNGAVCSRWSLHSAGPCRWEQEDGDRRGWGRGACSPSEAPGTAKDGAGDSEGPVSSNARLPPSRAGRRLDRLCSASRARRPRGLPLPPLFPGSPGLAQRPSQGRDAPQTPRHGHVKSQDHSHHLPAPPRGSQRQ